MSVVYRKEPVVRNVVVDVICDRCGKSCIMGHAPHQQVERARLEATWGYWSAHDEEHWQADLCEPCTEAVREFINAGDGVGVRVSYNG